MTPKTIGRYEIRSELGRGGMGAVYLAYDPTLQRDVAVKLLPSYFAQDPEFSQRFAREAKTVAGLDHRAIVAVYDYGEDDVWPYFVMRYMRGGSLKDRLAKGPLDLAQASHVLQRIGGALDKAHSKGVIHRDLKPANILYDAEGQPYLGDFGIMRLAESSENFTRTGNALGTPAYMSPEQVKADSSIDGRSDIYSLGVVLFEMLSGQAPYEDDSTFKVQTMHVSAPIPNLLERRTELPTAVQRVIDKTMAKDRKGRYQTAGELAAALDSVVTADRSAGSPRPAVVPASEPPKSPPAATPTPAAGQRQDNVQHPLPQQVTRQPFASQSARPSSQVATPDPAATHPAHKSIRSWIWILVRFVIVALIIATILFFVVWWINAGGLGL